MKEDIENYQYSLIYNYRYAEWFKEVQYNGKTLSDAEREELVSVIDETVDQYKEGLPMMIGELERCKDLHDEYHNVRKQEEGVQPTPPGKHLMGFPTKVTFGPCILSAMKLPLTARASPLLTQLDAVESRFL